MKGTMFTWVGCFLFAVGQTYTQILGYNSTSLIRNLANISVVIKQILLSLCALLRLSEQSPYGSH